MPEYLAPGVYIEETSFRPKTIEGVSTSTAGFVGPTRFGPISGEPELLTSYPAFERIYGGLEGLEFGEKGLQINYMAHAVRAFFSEGGRRLYVSRVYNNQDNSNNGKAEGVKKFSGPSGAELTVNARHPGAAGNGNVYILPKLGDDILDTAERVLRGAREYDVVLAKGTGNSGRGPSDDGTIYWLESEIDEANRKTFRFHPAAVESPSTDFLLTDTSVSVTQVKVLTVNVTFEGKGRFQDPQTWEGLGLHPQHMQGLTKVFAEKPINRATELWVPIAIGTENENGAAIAEALLSQDLPMATSPGRTILERFADENSEPTDVEVTLRVSLTGGSDGSVPAASHYEGEVEQSGLKNGLVAFEDLENISIVAAPGSTGFYGSDPVGKKASQAITNNLLTHCLKMRYRVAVLDTHPNQVVSEVSNWRAKFDSTHAALYYPWITVLDPAENKELNLPPSGFVAGIYARNDIEYGVHKAPANERVRGAINFEFLINKGQQDVLNPKGVNCFRFFPGRGFRLWGARTISSDPEWKYINVRRYFAYLERSIDRGTQWVVFENNSEPLWAKVTRTVADFLFNEWKSGHLMGTAPEEAYFVRCDRSTMTQNDIDNGRLICLIGVAPVKPAEFVIFRIGQWTADSNR
jgi:phage tail sheath protein FI